MSEETPKKKGRGPNSTAAGDPLIYTDEAGIKWPGKHVRFNKGKTMKLTNGKQVACTITVRLDGQSDTTVVPYLSVTYLPKPGKESAAERNAPPSTPEHLKQYPLLPKDVVQSPMEQPEWDARNLRMYPDEVVHPTGETLPWCPIVDLLTTDPIEQNQPPAEGYHISKVIDNGTEYTVDQYNQHMRQRPWRSVHDVVDETDVVWDNELQTAYVMVDSTTWEVFTYEVEPEIKSLADLQDLMQRKGWQMGEDAAQPPLMSMKILEQFISEHTLCDTARPRPMLIVINGEEFDTTGWSKEDFEAHLGLALPVDVPQEDRAAEEPKTVPTEMLALRWNDEILGPERLGYRIPGRQHIYGDRHYVIQTPGDNVVFAPGVTSILKATMPKPEELFKWAVEKFRSWEEYQRHMTLAQGKGSVIHGAIADAINGVLPDFQDTAAWLSYLAAACSRNGCKGMEREWLGIVQRSVASIRQWAADHKVVFLMVEKPLYAPPDFAGQLDFLVEMDSHIQNVKSTKAALREAPRRIIAIVDLKTGNDSDQYPAQLAYYRKLLLEGFPHIKKVIDQNYPSQSTIDGYNIPLYLLFPKTGWRKAPTYSFLDRTLKADEYAANEMQHHIELFKFKRRKPAGVTRLTGPANFNTTNDGVLSYTSLEDVWKDKIAQGDLEPVEDINEEDEAD